MASFYKAIPRTDFDTAGLSGTYQSIDASGLPEACLFVVFSNSSSNAISLSLDGSTDNEILLAGVTILPFAPFSAANEFDGVWKKTQQFWVKSSTSTAGTLYVSGYYL